MIIKQNYPNILLLGDAPHLHPATPAPVSLSVRVHIKRKVNEGASVGDATMRLSDTWTTQHAALSHCSCAPCMHLLRTNELLLCIGNKRNGEEQEGD